MREGWHLTTVGAVANVVVGGTPKTSVPEYWGGDIAWVTPVDVTAAATPWLSTTKRSVTQHGIDNSAARVVPRHSVLVSARGTVGTAVLAAHPMATNQSMLALIPGNGVLGQWLYYWVLYNRSLWVAHSGGSTFPAINAQGAKALPLLLAPLPEQRRIVDLIGSLDETIAATDQVVVKTEQASHATLHAAASRASRNALVGELAVVRGGKRLPKGTPWAAGATPHPYIRVVDMKAGTVDLESLVHVPDDVWPSIRKYVVERDDVLVSIAGTIGLVAQVPPSLEGANLTENAARISIEADRVDPRWVTAYLAGAQGQRAIAQRTVGTTQKKLGRFRIEQIPIPLLARADEEAVCGALDALAELAARARRMATALSLVRSALLSDLMGGNHSIPPAYDRLLVAA